MAITLAEIREEVRNRADMKETSFVEDPELNSYINLSISELHDIMTDAYQSDYYIETYEFASVVNQDSYPLPDDFYELRGVDVKISNDEWFTIKRYNFNERNRFRGPNTWNAYDVPSIRYRIVGSMLRFNPVADRETSIRMWYVPKSQKLVNDTDTFDDINGWIEYVIVDACIKCLQKEESDITVFAAQKADLERRIRSKAMDRDAANPESVYDIYAENSDYPWRSR